jgi:protein-S-isoprenylcysteine O-methyltransferase Ste14
MKALLKILFGCVLYAGLPLLGWGVTDAAGFCAQPARAAYLGMVLLLQIAVVLIDPAIGRQGEAAKRLIGRQRIAIPLLQVLSIAVLLLAPWSDRWNVLVWPPWESMRYTGLAIALGGFLLMARAETALGRNFSIHVAVRHGHELVTAGPYRYIRHPRYLGILLTDAGIILLFRSFLALVPLALLAAVILWRIHDEDVLLREEFGAEWDAYRARSWRLLPWMW